MNKKCENCWEFNRCKKDKKKGCAAFEHDMGKECWFIASLTEKVRDIKKYKRCLQCDWYRKFN